MAGKRCFVIGNGPSLRAEDLDKLVGEYSFASNRIWLMYEKTAWRPTFYMCQDYQMIRGECERILTYPAPVLLSYNGMFKFKLRFDNAIAYLCDKRPCVRRQLPLTFSRDCADHLIDGTTVTYSAIQLAVYMGFTEIYLLGVDNSYQYTMDKNRKITKDDSVKETYFDKRYKDVYDQFGQGKNKIFSVSDPELCESAYQAARKAAEESNILIANATRGGKLETFKRVVFDSLF